MFAHPTDKPTTLPAVTLHNNALILSLSQSDNQTVWRFDLDAIAEHGFRVTGREGFYDLSLVDLDETEHTLARFLDKHEAHQTLAAIHQALSNATTGCCGKDCTKSCCASTSSKGICGTSCGFVRRCFRWLTVWRALGLIILALLLYLLLRPLPVAMPPMDTAGRQPELGIPMDADQLLQ